MDNIIGVDIGGTKCSVILGLCVHSGADGAESHDENIEILDKIKFPTEVPKGVEFSLSRIEECITEILERNNRSLRDIRSVGISCGGPLDSKTGVIMSPPNLQGWDNIHIVKRFEEKFGIKTRLQNDANACALAEWRFGAAKGCSNVVFLTFGTGMGAGLILDGRLYSGTNDMAGEIGHVRLENMGPVGYGKAGSFEGFCSGGGIAQLARVKVLEKLQIGERVSFCQNAGQLEGLNAKLVGDAAEDGDELAREIYEICGSYLGRGLAILIDILNPEVIVIGSIFSRSMNLLWPAAKEVIDREALIHSRKVCKVVTSGLAEKLGDMAALTVAVYE